MAKNSPAISRRHWQSWSRVQVLADGRVLLEGGEYNLAKLVFTNKGAIYDPIAKTWTSVSPPDGWLNVAGVLRAAIGSVRYSAPRFRHRW